MTTDAQIAREWASHTRPAQDGWRLDWETWQAVCRHILATTTPPTQPTTMADVEWVDGVHAGLCAEHADYGLVRMIKLDTDGEIWFLTDQLKHDFSYPDYLTPIPGTRIDLAPRREPIDIDTDTEGDAPEQAGMLRPEDVPLGEVWEVETGGYTMIGVRNRTGDCPWEVTHPTDSRHGHYSRDSDITLICRLMTETTPDHPTVLTTVEDYENAPEGTIVSVFSNLPWIKIYDEWRRKGHSVVDSDMCGVPREVLRWGWGG